MTYSLPVFKIDKSQNSFGTKIIKTGCRSWFYCIEYLSIERTINNSKLLWFKKNGNYIRHDKITENDLIDYIR
jgi:hypothetical protein